ncbi:hypothetical protein JOC77_003177 [Peribacillus deserti]|uniref:DUF4025 domain-containing protein n=1 Tax=Peribacillus deserti TaxID=673318 RepID=A0ABS2QKP6_9BACI|nr:hypothetical protein [Peribacillus deserti]MBM7693733.1 hypothetical protein [Peribacillus deserti]
MTDKNLYNEEAVLANIKLNAKLEDNKVRASKEGMHEAESANIKIQDAFYGNDEDKQDFPPTYIYNDTPSIKVTGDED